MDFGKTVIDWFYKNKRDMPWRKTKNPYLIWLSEIILQQTRVNQGLSYYENFVQVFPNVASLAEAPVDKVLKLWQGLGYYSRARNLHYSARQIHFFNNDKIPDNYKDLLKLKGVGEYTAAAIASIAFNEPVAVADGNVQRVLSRIFCISSPVNSGEGKKAFKQKACTLLDENRPGDFNQALMEFGALHCTPLNPSCMNCPFAKDCCAFRRNEVEKYPVKQLRKKRKVRYFNYLRILYNNYTFLQKRTKNDIWNSLYQYPLIESYNEMSNSDIKKTKEWKRFFPDYFSEVEIIDSSGIYTHNLTHQKILARFFTVKLKSLDKFDASDLIKVHKDELNKYAIPKLIDNYHKNIQV